MKRFFSALIATLLLAIPLMPRTALAASASLYLSPASASVSQGSYLTVSVRENSGSTVVNSVQANLNYPADKLDFVSISSSAAFNFAVQSTGGGGSVHIARAASPAVKGDQLVASVRFKAKVSSGTASVTYAGGSAVVTSDGVSSSNILSGTAGGNYTLKPVPPPPAAVPKDTTPPSITAISVSSITAASAIISWITSEPASSEIDYGPNTNYGLAAVDPNLVTSHQLTLNSPLLTAGVTYHFLVKSADAAGNTTAAKDATLTTVGANLSIKVLDQKGKPAAGARVTLDDKTGLTNKDGQVTLSGFATGKHYGNVNYKGKITPVSYQINNVDPNGKPQAVNFKIEVTASRLPSILVLLIILIVIAAGIWMWRKRQAVGGPHPTQKLPNKTISPQ